MSDQDGATVLGLLAEAGRALPSTSGSTAARAEAAVLALLQDPDAQWHRSPAVRALRASTRRYVTSSHPDTSLCLWIAGCTAVVRVSRVP